MIPVLLSVSRLWEIFYYGRLCTTPHVILFSGRYDGFMDAFSLSSSKLLKRIKTEHETILSIEALGMDLRHIQFSTQTGNTIFTAGSGTAHIYVWDFNTGTLINKLTGHLQDVQTLKLWNNILISGSNDHTVKVR